MPNNVDNLPTLDDFTEKSLLTQEDVKKQADAAAAAQTINNGAAAATTDTAATSKAGDTTVKKGTKKTDTPGADDAAAKAAAEKKAADDKADVAATITPEALAALKAKADADVNSLTPEEQDILIKDGYLMEEEDKTTFWKDVEKIHGIELGDIDFGDVAPDSPEGAAIRDQVLVNKTVADYVEYLKENFPNSYKFLEHESNGGDVNELFNVVKTDYSKIELKADDVDTQKKVLTEFYKSKGFDEKRVARMVEADEDSPEGLLAAAKEALTAQQAAQKAAEEQVKQATAARQQAIEARNNQFRESVKKITDAGTIGNFGITDKKEKEEFYRFAMSNIYSDGKEGYQVVLPIDDTTLMPVLQQLLFAYKKGDLSSYVARTAATQNVKRLVRRVSQDPTKSSSQETNTQANVKKLPTMDAFMAN